MFPALLDADVPFYSHEIDAYWNDIGSLDELRQGNFDALPARSRSSPGAPEVSEGVRAASPLGDAEVNGPVLVGDGVEIGDGVDRRPGDRRRRLPVGDGAACATRSCWRRRAARRGRS